MPNPEPPKYKMYMVFGISRIGTLGPMAQTSEDGCHIHVHMRICLLVLFGSINWDLQGGHIMLHLQ